MARATLWVLLPLSLMFAMLLVSRGVPQNFSAPVSVPLIEAVQYQVPLTDAAGEQLKDAQGVARTRTEIARAQTIPLGPVASQDSQEAIKMLGTNGGGFFNANSAHPFENSTPLTNFLQMLAIFLIPAALVFAFGCMVADGRQGIAILATMTMLFIGL